ncbi:hypothetical protein BD408DRAFT_481572 [Parasitella parasitica]|nr:hypothetical protein BD408DRAFT_481572 [Parasitella parasitica]
MCDASSYDKNTGYYRGAPISNAEDSRQMSRQDLVATPWDDDNFSLCLDTFPLSRLARTKYNQYPSTASPLRKHWDSSSSCSSDPMNVNDREITYALKDTPLPGLTETEKKLTFTKSKKSRSIATLDRVSSKQDTAVVGGVFPYKNNSNFLARVNSEKNPNKVIARPKPIQRSNNNGRVEHISPLFSSPTILQNENNVLNKSSSLSRSPFTYKSSNSSVKSKFSGHSTMSFPTANAAAHRPQQDHICSNESQFSDSQYSYSGESWKLVQRKYSSSAIAVMPSSPPISQYGDPQYQITVSRSCSSPRHQMQQATYSSSRSASVICCDAYSNGKHSPLQYSNSVGSLGGFYTPQGSPVPSIASRHGNESISSYRSLPVLRNADHLVLYSDDGLSSHCEPASAKNRDSTYSQVFDPAYNGKRKNTHHKKVSVSIFTKLVKNLKQHFIKTASKE